MKARYLGIGTTGDFIKDQVVEAVYPKNPKTKKVLVIRDKRGDKYGYPASWFEIIEDDQKKKK